MLIYIHLWEVCNQNRRARYYRNSPKSKPRSKLMKIKRIKEFNENQQIAESRIKLLLDFPEICLNQNITLHYTVHETTRKFCGNNSVSKVGFGSSRTLCSLVSYWLSNFKAWKNLLSTYRPEIVLFKFVYLKKHWRQKKKRVDVPYLSNFHKMWLLSLRYNFDTERSLRVF